MMKTCKDNKQSLTISNHISIKLALSKIASHWRISKLIKHNLPSPLQEKHTKTKRSKEKSCYKEYKIPKEHSNDPMLNQENSKFESVNSRRTTKSMERWERDIGLWRGRKTSYKKNLEN